MVEVWPRVEQFRKKMCNYLFAMKMRGAYLFVKLVQFWRSKGKQIHVLRNYLIVWSAVY